mmetsp:Transcript_36919/g.73042  ORF Transcript_36919/g.73042 Transcript_36919/m.73042 type:complete len:249 (-) Transcript_36919:107-853(-)
MISSTSLSQAWPVCQRELFIPVASACKLLSEAGAKVAFGLFMAAVPVPPGRYSGGSTLCLATVFVIPEDTGSRLTAAVLPSILACALVAPACSSSCTKVRELLRDPKVQVPEVPEGECTPNFWRVRADSLASPVSLTGSPGAGPLHARSSSGSIACSPSTSCDLRPASTFCNRRASKRRNFNTSISSATASSSETRSTSLHPLSRTQQLATPTLSGMPASANSWRSHAGGGSSEFLAIPDLGLAAREP